MEAKLSKALKEIRDYVDGKEFRNFAKIYLMREYGENYNYKILEDRIKLYLDFFSDEEYTIPYLEYQNSLISIFKKIKLNYRQKGLILAYTLNKNAKLLENSSYKDLQTFALGLYEDCNNEKCTIDNLIRLFQFAPKIIRRYIDENGDFKPLIVLEGDKDLLTKMPFILNEEQIENILYFNQRKYEDLVKHRIENSSDQSKTEEIKEVKQSDYKLQNPIYKTLKLYLDEKGNVLETISDTDCDDLIALIKELNWDKERINQIQIQVNRIKKAHEEERKQDYLKKFEELKEEIFTEEDSKIYNLLVSLIQNKYFSPLFEENVANIINNINEALKDILNAKIKYDALIEAGKYKDVLINVDEETQKYEMLKKEDIAIMELYFDELREISNECALSEYSFGRGRKKNEN